VLEVKDAVTDHSVIEPDDDDFVFEADASDDDNDANDRRVSSIADIDDDEYDSIDRHNPFRSKSTKSPPKVVISSWPQIQQKINVIISMWSPELLCAAGVWTRIDIGSSLVSLLSIAQSHVHLFTSNDSKVSSPSLSPSDTLTWTNLCHKVFYLFRFVVIYQ
jgi:hypothetical protein